MKLSEKAIRDFKHIYQNLYGGEMISDETANELGLSFLRFFKLIYRPIPEDESFIKLGTNYENSRRNS